MAPQSRKGKTKDTSAEDAAKKKEEERTMGICILSFIHFYKKYCNVAFVKQSLTDPEYTWLIGLILLSCELIINGCIVLWRPCKMNFLAGRMTN